MLEGGQTVDQVPLWGSVDCVDENGGGVVFECGVAFIFDGFCSIPRSR